MSTKKKCIIQGLQVKFYLGQCENCSPGNNTSDISEKLFQRGRGKDSIYVMLAEGEYIKSSTYFL